MEVDWPALGRAVLIFVLFAVPIALAFCQKRREINAQVRDREQTRQMAQHFLAQKRQSQSGNADGRSVPPTVPVQLALVRHRKETDQAAQ